MKKGSLTNIDVHCVSCNAAAQGVCSDCHAPVCEKHAEFEQDYTRCNKCSESGGLFKLRAAVNETPLWWDILTFRFSPRTLIYEVVARDQYLKSMHRNPESILKAEFEKALGIVLTFHDALRAEDRPGYLVGDKIIHDSRN